MLTEKFHIAFYIFVDLQWVSQTVLCKLVKEINEINISLQKMGSSELQIGCKCVALFAYYCLS